MRNTLPSKVQAVLEQRSRRERRVAKRQTPRQPIPCVLRCPESPVPVSAWVQNLSRVGIALLTDHELQPGTVLQALLFNGMHTFSLAIGVTVVRCYRMHSGDFVLGMQFERTLEHDEMVPFLL